MIIIASIFIFSIAAIFRLLDVSASLLINHGISVSPFYLSEEEIRKNMEKVSDAMVIKKLNRTIKYQKLHRILLIIALSTFFLGIVYEFISPTFIYLF